MIRDILLMQKREIEHKKLERYVERRLSVPVRDNDLIKVVMGPRRCGKSFLAMHLLQNHESCGYVNFDDERLISVADYDEIIAGINSVYSQPKYLLLDEIQNLPKWELLVNRLQRQGYRLYITGSNAHLLSSELATHLTGRYESIILFPFSFTEYIQSQGVELTEAEIKQELMSYLKKGGFPEPLFKDVDSQSYLRTLWDSLIYKDIVKRHSIRSVAGISDLADYLLANISNEYAFKRLTELTKCRSEHTVQKYISYLEEAFLFFSLRRFSSKLKEQSKANRKIYCIDNGFVSAKGFLIRDITGALLENSVATTLKKRQLNGECEIYFWKSPQQEEVDFVIKKGNSVSQLIQVCWEMERIETRNREIRAILKASRDLKCKELLVITAGTDKIEAAEWQGIKEQIKMVPFHKWLLQG